MPSEREGPAVLRGVDRRRAVGVVALLALVALSGCHGILQHHRVCGVCSGAGDVVTGDLTVESSEMEIRTFENGSSRWTARMNVSGSATENLSARTDDLERAIENDFENVTVDSGKLHAAHDGDVRDVSVRASGDRLVATYRVPDVAIVRSDGYVVFRQFHKAYRPDEDHFNNFELGADRVEVRAPPGMAVVNDPGVATVVDDGRAVVWEHPEERWKDPIEVPGRSYTVFGPERTTGHRIAGRAVVAHETLVWSNPELVSVLAGSTGLIAAVIAVLGDLATGGGVRRRLRSRDVDPREFVSAGAFGLVGAAAIPVQLLLASVGSFSSVAALGIVLVEFGAAAAVLGVVTEREHWTWAPTSAFLLAFPAVPTVVLTLNLITLDGTVAPWLALLFGVPLATLVAVGFVVGFKLDGGSFRAE